MTDIIKFIADHNMYFIFGILILFGLLEALFGYYANSKRSKDDLFIEMVNTVFLMGITKPLIMLIGYKLLQWIVPTKEGALSEMPFWLGLTLFLLVDDVLQYWYHRSSHEYKWLWKWHRAHHTATEMGLLVSYREAVYFFMLMPNVWWLGVFTYFGGGIPVAVGIVLKQLIVISSHSIATWDSFFYKRPALMPVMRVLERIFITPAFHHGHHAVSKVDDIGNPNGNFGNMFSIWDQLFGTAKFTHAFPTEYGIPNDPEDSWASQSFYPLITSDKAGSEMSKAYKFEKTTVNEPAILTLKKGNYLYCECGYSKTQPFCDGSHHGTKFQPSRFEIKKEREYKLCNCKTCAKGPFCDDSHLKLPQPIKPIKEMALVADTEKVSASTSIDSNQSLYLSNTPTMELLTNTSSDTHTGISELNRVFALQKAAFLKNPYPSAKERIELMSRVPGMLKAYRQKIHDALNADFSGHSAETSDLFEIVGMFDRAKFNIDNIVKWMKPIAKAGNPVTGGSSKAYIKYHPKGVVGNMVSWNFPFDIAIGPMLDQLGAGNRVIIKSSDLSPACGAVLAEMISATYNEDQVAVVNGDLELAKYFPTLPWDHLIYTGSGAVGKQIMKAAAANLVPVTLELGGKCPSIVGEDRMTDETIATIAGVKVVKRGQMCVTVDYCLVPEAQKQVFVDKIVDYMQTHFAKDNAKAHACGIISQRHINRLQGLVEEAKASGAKVIQIGQDLKAGNRDMPFYIVVDPSDNLEMMKQEIFGPILAVKTYKSTQDAIAYVNKGDRPLGLYIFSDNRQFIDDITLNTQSGGVCVNMIALQAAQPSMGFGGVGASGMGRHHGEEGFKEFSYPKGYFERGKGGTIAWITPPFDNKTAQLIHDVAYAPMSKQLKFALSRLPNILFKKD